MRVAVPWVSGTSVLPLRREPVDARALTKIVQRHIFGTIPVISGLSTLLALNLTRATPASPA